MKRGVQKYPDDDSLRKSNNSTFLLIAGSLAVLIMLALCLGGYYLCAVREQCGIIDPEPIIDPTTAIPAPVTLTPVTITITSDNPRPITTFTYTPALTITKTHTSTNTPTNTPTFTVTYTETITTVLPPEVDPFDPFPPEFHEPPIQLPPQILEILREDGYLVSLPSTPEPLQQELTTVAYNFALTRFDFSRIVSFSTELNNEYIVVPISEDYFNRQFGKNEDFSRGALVGLIYDKNGGYKGVPDVYEIWAYEDHVSLTGLMFKNAIILQQDNNEYYWVSQNVSSSLPLAFFVKNGCWGCWRVDGRCGCLVCR